MTELWSQVEARHGRLESGAYRLLCPVHGSLIVSHARGLDSPSSKTAGTSRIDNPDAAKDAFS
jgi:hypothetical protein